jgi:4-diphosphocytidyl-2-C-methyl-D-erythritol kinase
VSSIGPGVVRTERAHAKVNLLLRILAREASGYHGLETLFQRLALHDVVHVAIVEGASGLTCHGPAMPPRGLGAVEKNLAWRAADAYTREASWRVQWQIDIEKHIPVGGGLGGGSADAAAVLRALETLCPTPLGPARLLEVAGGLGADVPFMVTGESLAWAWSRGDRLLPLPALPPMDVSLIAFRYGVNTGVAYNAFARARETRADLVGARAYSAAAFSDWSSVASLAANDFETVVADLHDGVRAVLPRVREAAAALCRRGHTAIGMMSGSGATCFVLHSPDIPVEIELPHGAQLVRTATA